MKRQQRSVVLAGLLAAALVLSGCKSMGWGGESGASGSSSSGATTGSGGQSGSGGSSSHGSGNPIGSSGSQGASGAAGATGSSSAQEGAAGAGQSMAPNGTVLVIEAVPSAAAGMNGSATSGSSGSQGATGGSADAYRITLRMDDGSTQVIMQGTPPDFRSGDRVHVGGGAIQR